MTWQRFSTSNALALGEGQVVGIRIAISLFKFCILSERGYRKLGLKMNLGSWLASDEFLTFWRIASPLGAAFSAYLGITREFRDKTTGKLTKSGLISVIGVLLSGALGVTASIAERVSDLNKQQEDRRIIHEISRSVSLIDEPRFTISFDATCEDRGVEGISAFLEPACADSPGWPRHHDPLDYEARTSRMTRSFSNLMNAVGFETSIAVHIRRLDGSSEPLEYVFFIPSNDGFSVGGLDRSIFVSINDAKPDGAVNDGTIRSWIDLNKAVIEVSCYNEDNPICSHLKFNRLSMRDNSGRSLVINSHDCREVNGRRLCYVENGKQTTAIDQ